VRAAIGPLDTQTFWGPTKFDSTGLPAGGESGVIQVQQGVVKVVYPNAIANAKPVYPMKAWQ
ncbi:MAG: amino acid ABC transporter substrate-binding protein, partial [Chloroflexota bacterium]